MTKGRVFLCKNCYTLIDMHKYMHKGVVFSIQMFYVNSKQKLKLKIFRIQDCQLEHLVSSRSLWVSLQRKSLSITS